jgi:hypothetical protein
VDVHFDLFRLFRFPCPNAKAAFARTRIRAYRRRIADVITKNFCVLASSIAGRRRSVIGILAENQGASL